MNLPAYVINLERDRERWETVAASAAEHAPQIVLHRVDAADGRAPEHAGREMADVPTFRRICGREMLPGEYGCYISHLKALRAFLDDGAPYGLILEDDVVFEADSSARIDAVLAVLPEFGVVKLVNHRTSMMVSLCDTPEGDTLGRTLHGPQGSAAAYLVSREGARHLLDALVPMVLPWDVALERAWDHGATVFTTRTNVLGFSEHRRKSNIAGSGYDIVKYPWYERLGAAAARTVDYVRRVHHVLKRPPQPARTAQPDPLPAVPLWLEIAAGFAVLLFVSAVWQETDSYRYAGIALAAVALVRYFRKSLWSYTERPYIGWAGLMCLGWAAYVAIRFLYSYLLYPEMGRGSAEGVYLLPVFYSTTGFALLLYVRRPFLLATAFVALSAAALAFGIDYDFGAHTRAVTLLHNNPIHASIAAGLISLCAIPYALHVARRGDLRPGTRFVLEMLATATFLLSLLAVYSLWSKGVWLAMAVALLALAGTVLATESGGRGRRVAVAAVLVALTGAAANYDMLRNIAAPTVETSVSLLTDIITGEGILASLASSIADASTQLSERERMMLWVNALRIWDDHPVFGAGISWLHAWQDRPYKEVSYSLFHNGYLEIAVRYGILGLAFYAVLFGWTVRCVWRAARAGLVDMAAFQCYAATTTFFAVTLLTNSNNRLAIGESYMWFGASFGFYCYYLLQRHGEVAPRTPI